MTATLAKPASTRQNPPAHARFGAVRDTLQQLDTRIKGLERDEDGF
jgi:hypothetical protein